MFARVAFAVLLSATAWTALGCAVDARAPGVDGDFAQLPHTESATGPCDDGATRECHVELSRSEEVVNCFSGVSVCSGGEWGACAAPEGSGGTMTSKQLAGLSDAPEGANTKALGEASPTTGLCASNPCDPYCQNYDERPATPYATQGVVSSWYDSVTGFGGSPPGFISKLVKEPCSSPIDCGYDMHCNAVTKKCDRNGPGWTYPPAQCATTDMTVGAACQVNGRITLPVCNRGNVAIAAGQVIKLALKQGNWISQPTCPSIAANAINCTQTLTSPLYPGACVQVDTCGYSGNVVAFVNAGLGVSECPGPASELGCSDNWSDVKVVPCELRSVTSYLPAVMQQQYKAVCPKGARISWQLLAYDGTIATNQSGSSGVKFEVQTAPLLANGSAGTFTPFVTAANTATGDPASCPVSGPTPCPKDLFTTLGGGDAAHQPVLNLKITLSPTLDQLAASTLRSWQLSYACIPTE